MGPSFRGTARPWIASVFVLTGVLAIGGSGTPAQGDFFVTQRDLEATVTGSRGFSVSFADSRRRFHPGEKITLRFTFERHDISPFNYEHCWGLGEADAVLDHVDGTADPQADLWGNGISRPICDVFGGVQGGGPITFSVYLNQAVRFDGSGRYRFYVRSWHRSPLGHIDSYLPPLISNVLELEILDRDLVWEARTLEAAISVIDASTDRTAREDAARTIAFLGSAEAAREMAGRFDRMRPGAGDSSALDPFWLRGLYGARDRAQAVAVMQRELERPDRYIARRFVSHLALLDLTRRVATRPIDRATYESEVRSLSRRHLGALKTAGTLRAHLAQTFRAAEDSDRFLRDSLTAGYVDFPEDVEAAFLSLTPERQQTVLETHRNWTVFRDPAFLPLLQRLARGASRGGPQDIALQLLYDLDPALGRGLALRELVRPDSPMSIVGLSVLPGTLLGQFDDALAASLEHASTAAQYTHAIDRIERFATGRIAGQVRRVYERFKGARGCTLGPPSLAYFFRVDPAYARTEINNVLQAVYDHDTCESGVFPAIASRRMLPAVEDAAVSSLNQANGWMVADAAHMLQEHGSSRAEAALWNALERWHQRWKDKGAILEAHRENRQRQGIPWEESIERDLSIALLRGAAWLMNEASVSRLVSLCVTRDCRDDVEHELLPADGWSTISVRAPQLPLDEPSFFVSDRTYHSLPSRDALRQWLRLQPRGTTIEWRESGFLILDDVWMPREAESYFEEAGRFAESRGVNLRRIGTQQHFFNGS